MLEGIGIKLVPQITVTEWFFSFRCNIILMIRIRSSFQSNSRGLVSFDNTSMFCLAFSQYRSKFSPPLFIGVFARHCRWYRNFSNFLLAFFHDVSWCSLILRVQWRRYHVIFCHYRAFGFSIAHFCFAFAFFWCIRTYDFPHIWPYIGRVLRVVCFPRQSSPLTMYIRQVAFHSKHLTILDLHLRFQ